MPDNTEHMNLKYEYLLYQQNEITL